MAFKTPLTAPKAPLMSRNPAPMTFVIAVLIAPIADQIAATSMNWPFAGCGTTMVITRISTRILARCVQTQLVRPFTNRRISGMAFSPSLLLEDRLHVVSELCAKHGVPLPYRVVVSHARRLLPYGRRDHPLHHGLALYGGRHTCCRQERRLARSHVYTLVFNRICGRHHLVHHRVRGLEGLEIRQGHSIVDVRKVSLDGVGIRRLGYRAVGLPEGVGQLGEVSRASIAHDAFEQNGIQIGRAHVSTRVTDVSRMP